MARMVLRRDLAGERSRPSLPPLDTHEGADDYEIYPRFSFFWRPEVRLRSLWEESPVPPRRSSGASNWEAIVPAKRKGRRTVWPSSCWDGTTFCSRVPQFDPRFCQTLTRPHGETAHPSGSAVRPSSRYGDDRSPYQEGPSGGPGLLWHPGSWPWA